MTWTLVYDAPIWTLNAERTWHWTARADRTAEWRTAFKILAMQAKLPKGLDRVAVTATPIRPSRKHALDVAGCFPAVKAAIDGIADYGLIADDGPKHLVALCFQVARIEDRHGLELIIEEV